MGMLIIFTLSILTFMSTISLQMLCYVDNLDQFSTFPKVSGERLLMSVTWRQKATIILSSHLTMATLSCLRERHVLAISLGLIAGL